MNSKEKKFNSININVNAKDKDSLHNKYDIDLNFGRKMQK